MPRFPNPRRGLPHSPQVLHLICESSDLLAERGLGLSYETVRRWVLKFGRAYARRVQRRRPRPTERWHLDEMVVVIRGRRYFLWRAVDSEGEVLDFLIQSRRNTKAAIRLMRKLLKKQGFAPSTIVTDKLRSYGLYHRAECLTHVGDSQAVRSLTQCGEPMRFAMAAPIDLRNDFDSVSLRRLAKRTRDATQSRRLLALAEVYDGGSRTDASRIGGVGLQIIRDWVLRFNARGPDGLVDGKSPGAPSKLNADHRRALAEVVEAGPVPAVDGVVRWRRKDLARWLLETFAISLDETTVGRELKALGFAKISARPRHYAQNELAVEAFKKTSPPNWRRSGRGSRKASR